MAVLVDHDGRSAVRFGVLREHGVDVHDEPRNEACMSGAAPPGAAAHRPEQFAQEWPSRRLEGPFRKDTALRSVPNVERRLGVFAQHLLQPQLIRRIQGALAVKASGHEFGNVAVFGDGHPDHRPLRHRRIVLVALERARIVFDL